MIYQDKRRKTWYFRVYVEDYMGVMKQKCRSGFSTKKQAVEEEKKFLLNYDPDFKDITFQELYDIFIQQKEQTMSLNSYETIKKRYKLHILPFFKDYKLSKITNTTYIEWKSMILKKNLAYRTRNNLHLCMVNILNYAMDFYNLERNIASKVGGFSKKDFIQKITFWTYEEFTRFISYVDDIVYNTYFTVLYATGMRKGESLALQWTDIKEDYIDITKSLSKERINKKRIITSPKTKSSIRKIKIDKHTMECLSKLKEHYSKMINFNDNWYIFGGIEPLAYTTLENRLKKYCELAKVKKIRIHDFRHSHATLLLSKNIPIPVISKRLGHSSIDMTLKVYSHLIPEDETRATDLFDTLYKEKEILREFQENESKEHEKTPINREVIN